MDEPADMPPVINPHHFPHLDDYLNNPFAYTCDLYDDLDENDAFRLSERLRTDGVIKKIALIGCGVNPRGVSYIAKALMQNCTLSFLDLTGNEVGEDGARAFKLALSTNVMMQVLSLRQTQLTDRCVELIAAGLRRNKTLQRLYLANNEITNVGAHALADDPEVLSNIVEIDVANNPMDAAAAELVVDRTVQNRNRSHTYCSLQNVDFVVGGGNAYNAEHIVCCHISEQQLHAAFSPVTTNNYGQLRSVTVHGVSLPDQQTYLPPTLLSMQGLNRLTMITCGITSDPNNAHSLPPPPPADGQDHDVDMGNNYPHNNGNGNGSNDTSMEDTTSNNNNNNSNNSSSSSSSNPPAKRSRLDLDGRFTTN